MAIERNRGSSRHSSAPYPPHPPHVKPFSAKLKDCCRFTIAFIFSNVGVCGLMVGYTIMGAFLFREIEGPYETTTVMGMDKDRNMTIEMLWNITAELNILHPENWTKQVEKVVKEYQLKVIGAVGDGWDGGESTGSPSQWSIEGGFLYSLTVITTIGYGHISPNTDQGKIMTIFYTIFGMPVFLLYMANMGDILAKSLKWTYSKLCMCKEKKENKFDTAVAWRQAQITMANPAGASGSAEDPYAAELAEHLSIESWHSEDEKQDITSVNIPITISLSIMIGLLYGGTILFQEYEGWDLLTSFYFCFISLTTIGFGDYVPGSSIESVEDGNRMSFIYCSLYLMFGLALLSMCFNLMQEEVVHKVTACLKQVKIFKRQEPPPEVEDDL
ncbi:unnamed protein product [Meganyctiphanes norvegica]|uniref:Potassium channel domain-containing protein n=1 Tax=Meganyctiphanes norvegica TaxID=48144 RepID=A0AAV2PKI0_MEGNR